MEANPGKLEQALGQLPLTVTPVQLEQLQQYLSLLQKWNGVYNLVADSSEDEIIHRHLLDSLVVDPLLEGGTLLDFGTGAGLPGIPLAILNPGRKFILLDSNGKKTRFLFQVRLELGLTNVTIENCRMEHYKPTDQINTVLCRAVASLPCIMDKVEALVAGGSQLMALKGQLTPSELEAVATLRKKGASVEIHRLDSSQRRGGHGGHGGHGDRHLVAIRHQGQAVKSTM